jgi:peptide/nickel transport system substrate-binding protein
MLFASWLSGAPEDTVFSLPSPVTPLRDGTAVSILRVTTSSSASLGNFTLRILGVNGGLSHYVDVAIRIRSQCIIATASYGSELAPEVQLLKMFRDSMLLKTFAGSTFMTAFNTWYYSFSPNVAGYIADNPATTTSMRLALYPMIMILKLGAATFTVANGSPEAAAVLSGFVISGLIGAVYLTVPISILLSRARSRRIATRLEHVMLGTVLGSGFGIIFAELLQASLMLMLVTPAFVLAVMTLSGLLASRFLMSICSFLGKRYLV